MDDPSLDVVRGAVEELRRRDVDFPFDGELQADGLDTPYPSWEELKAEDRAGYHAAGVMACGGTWRGVLAVWIALAPLLGAVVPRESRARGCPRARITGPWWVRQ